MRRKNARSAAAIIAGRDHDCDAAARQGVESLLQRILARRRGTGPQRSAHTVLRPSRGLHGLCVLVSHQGASKRMLDKRRLQAVWCRDSARRQLRGFNTLKELVVGSRVAGPGFTTEAKRRTG